MLEGHHGLTRINIWIKLVIIIVLKLDSGVESRKVQVTGQEGQLG
jgi:hypothetical protein